jgi:type I restriction enzyme, S subunit
MEVKPGYKQTEVGGIPEDWEAKSLGELGTVVRGGSPRPAGDPRYFNGSFIPWLTVAALTNISDHQIAVGKTVGFLTEEGAKRSRMLPEGTLIIANSGATLGVAKLLDVTCCANDGIAAVTDQRLGHKPFVCYYLNTQTKRLRDVVATGNGQPNLNTGLIRTIAIPFPPLAEQRAIATALSDVDGLLGALDRLIAKKRDLKQAAMQQLLTGQTRLPGFSGEWEVKRLGEVITHCFSGATPRRNRPDFYKGNIRWITSGELNYNVITDTIEKISSAAVAETNLTIHPVGTFLMAITGLEAEGTRGACGIVGAPSTTNQSCMAVFPSAALAREYLFHYYVFRGKSLALEYCQGTKQQSYTASLVKQLPIELPPTVSEQTGIAAVLSDMDAELSALEQRREKTRALKQGMMQELLTGRTRLL